MKMVLRIGWAFVGLILSVPAFLPPLAFAIANLSMGASAGTSLSRMLALLWRYPHEAALVGVGGIYCLYWICIAILVLQFVFDRELWLVPLAIVAVVMASALVALQPWHASGEPFMLGPFVFLHVAFMATVAWPSFRKSRVAV